MTGSQMDRRQLQPLLNLLPMWNSDDWGDGDDDGVLNDDCYAAGGRGRIGRSGRSLSSQLPRLLY